MSTFSLDFASDKRDFTLQVTCVACLRRAAVPFSCLSGPVLQIKTTDQLAVACLQQSLGLSVLDACGETRRALLVETNASHWLVYGRRVAAAASALDEDAQGSYVVQCFARAVVAYATPEQRILQASLPVQKEDGAQFLSGKKRRLVDTFVKEKKKQRRISPQKIADVSTGITADAALSLTASSSSTASRSEQVLKTKVKTVVKEKATKQEKSLQPGSSSTESIERRAKDKLKRIVVTSLRAQNIDKGHAEFGDLYQHTLQASLFALRQSMSLPTRAWEETAVGVVEDLLRLFCLAP